MGSEKNSDALDSPPDSEDDLPSYKDSTVDQESGPDEHARASRPGLLRRLFKRDEKKERKGKAKATDATPEKK